MYVVQDIGTTGINGKFIHGSTGTVFASRSYYSRSIISVIR
jgi:hypothetical protein